MNSEEEYLAEFSQQGEDHVRAQLEKGRYSEFKANLARHYLSEIDRERSRASQAAAEADAHAARRNAMIANMIAALALIVAIFTLVF